MDIFVSELLEELKIELNVTEESDIKILSIKLKNAIKEIRNSFNFKPYHDDSFILGELEKHTYNIKRLTIYDFAKIGAENETSHSEKNIDRVYEDRIKCFSGIVPFAD